MRPVLTPAPFTVTPDNAPGLLQLAATCPPPTLAQVSAAAENITEQPAVVEADRQLAEAFKSARATIADLLGPCRCELSRCVSAALYVGTPLEPEYCCRVYPVVGPEHFACPVIGMGESVEQAVMRCVANVDVEYRIRRVYAGGDVVNYDGKEPEAVEVPGLCRVTMHGKNETAESMLAKARRFCLNPVYLDVALHYAAGEPGLVDLRTAYQDAPLCEDCGKRHPPEHDCFDPR